MNKEIELVEAAEDATKALEPTKQSFDLIAFAIERLLYCLRPLIYIEAGCKRCNRYSDFPGSS